jgi:hypothetical protein
MNRVPPVNESALVKSLGHQGETCEVEVQTGEVYRYEPVHVQTFEAFRTAKSAGQFLNAVLKPACDCWKLVKKADATAAA